VLSLFDQNRHREDRVPLSAMNIGVPVEAVGVSFNPRHPQSDAPLRRSFEVDQERESFKIMRVRSEPEILVVVEEILEEEVVDLLEEAGIVLGTVIDPIVTPQTMSVAW
jgi:hypothetical protein